MRNINYKLKNHIEGEVTTIATCLKLILKSGKILAFCDCDIDIYFEELIYKSSYGFNPSSINTSSSLSTDNLELNMMITDDSITEDDLNSGIYDHAEIEIFLINYLKPDDGVIKLTRGFISEININNNKCTAQVKGLTYKFDKLIGQLYSPVCRAKFADERCMVNKIKYKKESIISEIESSYIFSDKSRTEANSYYNFGIVEFPQHQFKTEIKDYFNKKIESFIPFPKKLKAGDKYFITPGCDRSFNMCKNKYNNAINFRGEPYVPGNRYLNSVSGN